MIYFLVHTLCCNRYYIVPSNELFTSEELALHAIVHVVTSGTSDEMKAMKASLKKADLDAKLYDVTLN